MVPVHPLWWLGPLGPYQGLTRHTVLGPVSRFSPVPGDPQDEKRSVVVTDSGTCVLSK